jgi:hypothetical protein
VNKVRPASVAALAPRALNARGLAAYLGISQSQARQLLVSGLLRLVKLPTPRVGRRRVMRRLLVRVMDVDVFVDAHVGEYDLADMKAKNAREPRRRHASGVGCSGKQGRGDSA